MAKVTGDLECPRGQDLLHKIEVPRSWLSEGAQLLVTLPKNLPCAGCEGGGCDGCARSGALCTREQDEAAVEVGVTLPGGTAEGVRIRIPELGAVSDVPELGRGHLLLTVVAGPSPSPGVLRQPQRPVGSSHERQDLMRTSLFVAVVLILLFFGMLRLSGWL